RFPTLNAPIQAGQGAWTGRLADGTQVVARPMAEDGASTRERLRALGGVRHPALDQVIGAATSRGRLWSIAEHLPGRTLAAVLEAGDSLSPVLVTAVGTAVLQALEALHRAG